MRDIHEITHTFGIIYHGKTVETTEKGVSTSSNEGGEGPVIFRYSAKEDGMKAVAGEESLPCATEPAKDIKRTTSLYLCIHEME